MGTTEKKNPTINIEVQVDGKGNIEGVEINCKGLSIFEAIAVIEIAKLNVINSQVKKESWTKKFVK